jgi:hypothetical protein
MNCADAEILICDYATLASADRFALERHLAECPACAELARDSAAALAFLERAADVEPPPELVNKILFDQRWKQQSRTSGIRHWFHKLLQPVLQPKLAMSMALTVLFLAALGRYVAPARPLTSADFNPVRLWQSLDDRVYRGWQRSVKFYESIKFVYQVRARLQEWNQQRDEEQAAQNRPAAEKAPDEKRLPVTKAPNPEQK